MSTTSNNPLVKKFLPVGQKREPKNYARPDVLRRTFETLSNLHKLLPNRMMEMLYSYKSDEDKKKCETADLSGLERILERHHFPPEVNLTPKPSRIPSWKRKAISSVPKMWKECPLWITNSDKPPMCTIEARWRKNAQPHEDLKSVMDQLAAFGPIQSVTTSGRQSAIVVFRDTDAACKAVSAFHNKAPGTMLHCSWQQRFMSKDRAYSEKHTKKTKPKEYNQKTKKKRALQSEAPNRYGGARRGGAKSLSDLHHYRAELLSGAELYKNRVIQYGPSRV
uniref:RRM domain-containing protein n=1 Tax=Chinchilla lanigera TaxID=34839 RepID=A0A8C2UUH5_CHILA